MTQIRIITQNIGDIGLAKNKQKLCNLRLHIHTHKPCIVILTETRHTQADKIEGTIKGYTASQHDTSGTRSAGLIIYSRKGIENLTQYNIRSQEGHYLIGIYVIEGRRVIIGGIYGPSCSSDSKASKVFGKFIEQYEEIRISSKAEYGVVGGDFNCIWIMIERNLEHARLSKIIWKNVD